MDQSLLNLRVLAEKIPYFILDVLQQTPSVQVPGLGRFEAIFHPAVIDIPGARIKPPYVEPDFRDDQSTPDTLLADYIQYVTGENPATIRAAIDHFVHLVFVHTEGGQTYPVEKFGTFSRSATGGIRFTPDWDAFNLSFNGLESLDIKPLQPSSPPAPPVTIAEPLTPPVSESTEVISSPPEPEKSPMPMPEVIIPESKPAEEGPIDENTSKLWWMILISAIVLITVLCAYLAWDIISNRNRLNELKQISPDSMAVTRVEEPVDVPDTTPIAVEEIPVEEPDKEPEVSVPAVEEPQAGTEPCYIIVGAFGDPVNIQKMKDRLQSMGYTAEEIKGGNLTKVAIRTSCDQATLQKTLNDARSSIHPEAWIY